MNSLNAYVSINFLSLQNRKSQMDRNEVPERPLGDSSAAPPCGQTSIYTADAVTLFEQILADSPKLPKLLFSKQAYTYYIWLFFLSSVDRNVVDLGSRRKL